MEILFMPSRIWMALGGHQHSDIYYLLGWGWGKKKFGNFECSQKIREVKFLVASKKWPWQIKAIKGTDRSVTALLNLHKIYSWINQMLSRAKDQKGSGQACILGMLLPWLWGFHWKGHLLYPSDEFLWWDSREGLSLWSQFSGRNRMPQSQAT